MSVSIQDRIRALEEAVVGCRFLAERRPDLGAVCRAVEAALMEKRSVIIKDPQRSDDDFALCAAAELHALAAPGATQWPGSA